MTKDEALKLALKTLDSIWYSRSHDLDGIAETVIAIHAAMQQPEPEPVAWTDQDFTNIYISEMVAKEKKADVPLYTATPKREPLTDVKTNCKEKRDNGGVCPHHNLQCGWPECNESDPLKREPLTDEQITSIWNSKPRWHAPPIGVTDIEFARAIEAAHGIKGEA